MSSLSISKNTTSGYAHEQRTLLTDQYTVHKTGKYYQSVTFNQDEDRTPIRVIHGLKSYMRANNNYAFANTNRCQAHGCVRPDECFVHEASKNLFIIEKKFQQVHGSVIEKIQGYPFKVKNYSEQFGGKYTIHYIFCLSPFFETHCPEEITYLRQMRAPLFWSSDPNYKSSIINYILRVCAGEK